MIGERTTLEQALEMVRHLDLADQIKLRQVLDRLIVEVPREERERLLKRLLLERGLMTEIRPPTLRPRERRPITVKGQPLSEFIIEERR
jgi:hypothetical protein